MTALTVAAALAFIAQHQCVPPSVAPVVVGIAQGESGLIPTAIHDNVSGRRYYPETVAQAVVIARSLVVIGHSSLDLGIGQINTANLGWTGLTIERAFDACANFSAAAKVLFAKYNGSPPDAVKAAYAAGATARIQAIDASGPVQSPQQPANSKPEPNAASRSMRDLLHPSDPAAKLPPDLIQLPPPDPKQEHTQ